MKKIPLKWIVLTLAGLLALAVPVYLLLRTEGVSDSEKLSVDGVESEYYSQLTNNQVKCTLCFRNCIIEEGESGKCRNRANLAGKLYSLTYAKPSVIHVEPVEKHSLLHLLPGSSALCIGTAGCSFNCRNCNTSEVSQQSVGLIKNYNLSSEEAVALAGKIGCPLILFTYAEPTVSFEYMRDTFRIATKAGIKTVFHTNGAIKPGPLRELLEHTDGVIVDLKGFDNDFYKSVCSGRLGPVLHSLKIISEAGVHLEIINLVIPTYNDNPERIKIMCNWIAGNLGKNVPLHFTRFMPSYRMKNLPPTSLKTLEEALNTARECGLKHAYISNHPESGYNSTNCHNCGRSLIKRSHLRIITNNIKKGKCRYCRSTIKGIWK